MRIKLLSFNIHKGFNWCSSQLTLERMKDALLAMDADIIFLQEVIGEHAAHSKKIKHWPKQPQYELLAHTMWPHCAYGKNAIYADGHHGNAILSKFPITSWYKQDISTNRFESRGILYCSIALPTDADSLPRLLHAYCLHLDLFHRGRKKQYHAIMEKLLHDTQDGNPIVVAGDFNDWNQQSGAIFEKKLAMQEMFKQMQGQHAKTFPIYYPLLKLDRIYIKNLSAKHAVTLRQHPWDQLSDHAALYGEVTL